MKKKRTHQQQQNDNNAMVKYCEQKEKELNAHLGIQTTANT